MRRSDLFDARVGKFLDMTAIEDLQRSVTPLNNANTGQLTNGAGNCVARRA